MSEDLIKREDAIKAIHNYWKKRLDTLPTVDIQQTDKILEHNKTLCNFINAIPSTDRPNEVIYGNEHNCIMTIFGECSYAETGCGDCAVVEKVRKALSTDRPQEWIPCSERLPEIGQKVLASTKKTVFTQVFKGYHLDPKRWAWENNRVKRIEAWQPLPKPWKGADDEID